MGRRIREVTTMAEEKKDKLLEAEEVRQRIEDLRRRVGEMADRLVADARSGWPT